MISPLPVWTHELVVAPAVLLLAFSHARRALGARRAAGELLALAAYGFALERVAILVFASHAYGGGWRAAPWGVPLAVAAVWPGVIVSAMALAARLGFRSPAARAGAAALIGISLDLLMEPAAVRAGLWRWTPPGPWLGVPFGNFVGWGVIVGAYTAGAEILGGGGGALRSGARRAGLAALSILALVAVGLLWTALAAERLFAGAGGFCAWGAALAATFSLPALTRKGSDGSGLAGELGATEGPEPIAVFLGLASVFAWDALAVGGPALTLVAAGTALALSRIALSSLASRAPQARPAAGRADARPRPRPVT